MSGTSLIAQLVAQIQASGQNPSAVLAALSSAYPAEQPAPQVGGWKGAIDARLQGAPTSDPNMRTTAPNTNDRMMVNPSDPALATHRAGQSVTGIADTMPGLGPLPGQLFLNSKIAPQVPPGVPRPLSPGEWVQNPDGSWSSEITETIGQGEAPQLNGGRSTIVPTLWIVDGKPVRVDADTAAAYAVRSGLPFRSFETNDAAEAFSQQRENSWQSLKPAEAGSVAPLWAAPVTDPTQGAVQGIPVTPRQPAQGAVNGLSSIGDVIPFPQKPVQPISPSGESLTPDQFSERLKGLDWSYKKPAPTKPVGDGI